MKMSIVAIAIAMAIPQTDVDPVACELVDPSSAETILGDGATNLSGTEVPSICMYMSAQGNLMLQVQILGVEMYDAVPIHPRTPVEIGDRGRYNEDDAGTTIVQFAKDDYSVRISVTTRSGPPGSHIDALLEVARTAASRM